MHIGHKLFSPHYALPYHSYHGIIIAKRAAASPSGKRDRFDYGSSEEGYNSIITSKFFIPVDIVSFTAVSFTTLVDRRL